VDRYGGACTVGSKQWVTPALIALNALLEYKLLDLHLPHVNLTLSTSFILRYAQGIHSMNTIDMKYWIPTVSPDPRAMIGGR
jgi:hypothetical protein